MPLPTLLRSGSIPNNTEIPINYIINIIKQKMFEYGNTSATLNDRIFVIKAETGSGKSTILPVEIFRILRNKDTPLSTKYNGPKVICTQPRVLTAVELAKDVCGINKDMILGKTVGYQTKPLTERPRTGLIYATLGILSRQLSIYSDDQIMNEYKFIIIDEAHERTIGSDIVLFMLYHFYNRNIGNKNLPFLILTSATIEPKKYTTYFNILEKNIILVTGQSFPINTNWAPNDISNLYSYISDVIKQICTFDDDPSKADVLIFVPGMKEIKKVADTLSKLKSNILILKLDSKAVENNTLEYQLIFKNYKSLPLVNGNIPRRVIISTAVAETGLTIKTCKYVIDMGFHRSIENYPIINATGLITKPATKSRITQRRGRVGRLFNGEFYPTYTEDTFKLLEDQQLPEIFTSSNDYNYSHLKLYKILNDSGIDFYINTINLLDRPSLDTFINANSIATLLGYVDHESKLTKLGKLVSNFSFISMEQAKIIFSGFVYNVDIMDLITICAIMTIDKDKLFLSEKKYKMYMEENNIKYNTSLPCCDAYSLEFSLPTFLKDSNNNKDDNYYYRYKLLICDEFIETLYIFEAFVKIIMFYKDITLVKKWCMDHCLQLSTLQSIYSERENIIDDLLISGIDILHNSKYKLIYQNEENFMTTISNIKQCIYEGLKHNIIIYNDNEKIYKSIRNIPISINSNILSNKVQNKLKAVDIILNDIHPKYIITDKLIISSNNFDLLIYNLTTNFISIIDGYIQPDISLGEILLP